MSLQEQILSFIFSFCYGIIFSYLYNLNYKFIYNTKILYKVLINILFCLDLFLIYFVLLLRINDGIIHIYFLIVFFLGFYLFKNKHKNMRKFVKLYVNKKKGYSIKDKIDI